MNPNTSRALIRKLKRFYAMPFSRQRLILEAACWLTLASLVVERVPIRFWQKLLGTRAAGRPTGPGPADILPSSALYARNLKVTAAQLPWHPVCLPQAVALKWMLTVRQHNCLVVFGVSRHSDMKNTNRKAHAWVVEQGCVLLGGPVDEYTPLCYFQ